MKKFLQKILSYFVKSLQFQLFLSLVSFPILIGWGLPFSLLTFFGNIIFNYVLMLFLLISMMIFLCEICHLPDGLFILALEKLSSIWMTLMKGVNPSTWMITLYRPSSILLLCITLFAFLILQHKKMISIYRVIVAFLVLSCLIIGYLKFIAADRSFVSSVGHSNKKIDIIRENGQTLLIDNGIFNKQFTPNSWVEYTLVPELIKKSGSSNIDHYVVLCINSRTLSGIAYLCEKTKIKNIYLPVWEGQMSRSQKRGYACFINQIKKSLTKVIRLKDRPVTINLGKNKSIVISFDKKKKIKKELISYDNWSVTLHDKRIARAGEASELGINNGKHIRKY